MSHSEKVCRVGSMALAPIVVVVIAALAGAILCGAFWLFSLLPTAAHEAHRDGALPFMAYIVMSLPPGAFLALLASQVYPTLYRHCRGAEALAQFEALDKEGVELEKDYRKKLNDLNNRKAEFMRSLRASEPK